MVSKKNILAKLSRKSSLTPCREINFFWGKKLYIELCSSEGNSGIACFTGRGVADERNKNIHR
jgi:hypothetical protein